MSRRHALLQTVPKFATTRGVQRSPTGSAGKKQYTNPTDGLQVQQIRPSAKFTHAMCARSRPIPPKRRVANAIIYYTGDSKTRERLKQSRRPLQKPTPQLARDKTHRRIFTLDGSNDADSRNDVRFGGFVDIASHVRGEMSRKPQFWGHE